MTSSENYRGHTGSYEIKAEEYLLYEFHETRAYRFLFASVLAMVCPLIVRQALRPVATGVVIGLACSAAASNILSSVLYGIIPRDPVSFLFVPVFLLAIAVLASYLPARRAAKVDPMVALRCE